ncbi:hypothetical protein T484DRAFT_1936679 [Baffinella frigidus]|nr:hypothetical protein T484DRAFT_1936679 [Cryptophyta sp. CCMP2293]
MPLAVFPARLGILLAPIHLPLPPRLALAIRLHHGRAHCLLLHRVAPPLCLRLLLPRGWSLLTLSLSLSEARPRVLLGVFIPRCRSGQPRHHPR